MAKILLMGMMGGILAVTVKKYKPELGMHVSIATGVILFCMVLSDLMQAVQFFREFAAQYSEMLSGLMLVLKVIGIAYLCEFAVQILKDSGENAIASKVELGGKIGIMMMVLPLLTQFIQLTLSLL